MWVTINIQRMPDDIKSMLNDYIMIIRNTLLQLKRFYPIRIFVGKKYGTILVELMDESLNPYIRNALRHSITMEEPRAFAELTLSLRGKGWFINRVGPYAINASIMGHPKRFFGIYPAMMVNARVYGKYGVIAYTARSTYAEAYEDVPPVTDTLRMYYMILQRHEDTITI